MAWYAFGGQAYTFQKKKCDCFSSRKDPTPMDIKLHVILYYTAKNIKLDKQAKLIGAQNGMIIALIIIW